jgi:hypothetical protein
LLLNHRLLADHLPRGRIEHVKRAVARCSHRHMPSPAAERDVGQHDVKVLSLAERRTRLVVPGVFAAVGMNGHDTAGKQLRPAGGFLSCITLVTERF